MIEFKHLRNWTYPFTYLEVFSHIVPPIYAKTKPSIYQKKKTKQNHLRVFMLCFPVAHNWSQGYVPGIETHHGEAQRRPPHLCVRAGV